MSVGNQLWPKEIDRESISTEKTMISFTTSKKLNWFSISYLEIFTWVADTDINRKRKFISSRQRAARVLPEDTASDWSRRRHDRWDQIEEGETESDFYRQMDRGKRTDAVVSIDSRTVGTWARIDFKNASISLHSLSKNRWSVANSECWAPSC
jgi:hypothetical protein